MLKFSDPHFPYSDICTANSPTLVMLGQETQPTYPKPDDTHHQIPLKLAGGVVNYI